MPSSRAMGGWCRAGGRHLRPPQPALALRPYHQHPDGGVRSRHGVDALILDKGVRPLLVEQQPDAGRGREEGHVVFLAYVQDQLQACGGGGPSAA